MIAARKIPGKLGRRHFHRSYRLHLGDPKGCVFARSHGSRRSKFYVVADGPSISLVVETHAKQACKSARFELVMNAMRIRRLSVVRGRRDDDWVAQWGLAPPQRCLRKETSSDEGQATAWDTSLERCLSHCAPRPCELRGDKGKMRFNRATEARSQTALGQMSV